MMQTTDELAKNTDGSIRAEQVLRLSKLQWEQYRAKYQAALGVLNDAVLSAAESGMSQSEIGRALEWPRQRVSKLLADLAADTRG
jgi:hypothetical protein